MFGFSKKKASLSRSAKSSGRHFNIEALESRQMFAADAFSSPESLGDLDSDGYVTGLDFLRWQREYAATSTTSPDLSVWEANYGQSVDEIRAALRVPVSDIIDVYNTQSNALLGVIPTFVQESFGQDLPVTHETIGEELNLVEKLNSVFDLNLTGLSVEELESQIESLAAEGFTLEYAGSEVDENGDLLRISFDRTYDTDLVDFDVLGDTGFEYFDGQVNGGFSGSIQGQSPDIHIQMTFGVDLLEGVPTFYLSDESQINISGLDASGQVDGRMALRFLAGVSASGTFSAELDAHVTLQDSDSDHKLRLSDLSNSNSIVGDVDGNFHLDVNLHTDLPVLSEIQWHGTWQSSMENGVLTNSSPNLTLPSADEVLAAVLTSFVDMKEDFAILGPIGEIINAELPGIGTSIASLSGAGDRLGWLDEAAGSVTAVKEELSELGIAIAEINADTVHRLLSGEKVDLVSFHAASNEPLLSNSPEVPIAVAPLGVPFAVTVSGTVDAELGWQYEVGFGVDTTGVWIDPRTSVGIWGGVSAGVKAELTFAGLLGVNLEAGAGVQVFAGLGLRDPHVSDGRIYMDEIWRGAEDDRDLATAILDVIDVDMRIDAQGYVRAELDLPWPLPDITLVDESFNLGAILNQSISAIQVDTLRRIPLPGEGEVTPPAVLQADGTLLITGTAQNDYLDLTGQDGNVQLQWSGYTDMSYVGVQRVQFYGNEGDDVLNVSKSFNIPIEAHGGLGKDRLVGSQVDDILDGGEGDDKLFGLSGNDTIHGGSGMDAIQGGDGNDVIYGESGIDTIRGNAGDDLIYGGADADIIYGGDGADILYGDQGADTIDGGAGDDSLFGGTGRDYLTGDIGVDLLYGEDDADTLDGGLGNDSLFGGNGDDFLAGGSGDDFLTGSDGDDLLLGGEGNDVAHGNRGSDFIHGGDGADMLYGSTLADNVVDENDIDTVSGGAGDDFIRGGRGVDYLNGEQGSDDINGEAGEDIIIVDLQTSGGGIADNLAGGVDRDQLWITPAYSQNDKLETETGNLLADSLERRLSGDTDPLDLNALAAVTNTAATTGTGDNEIYLTQTSTDDFLVEQFDRLTGELVTSMTFTLTGGANTDLEIITIAGMDGNDLIQVSENTTRNIYLDGGDGNDTLIGGSGKDVIKGGLGDDTLIGGGNNDELHGDDGNDVLQGNAGTDRLYGGDGDDSLNGNEGFDVLYGGEGNDTIDGGTGSDGKLIYGEAGDDVLIGSDGKDVIDGGDGVDHILGGVGDDVLLGGDGNDVIRGQSGHDVILGGRGNDGLYAGDDDESVEPLLTDFRTPYEQLLLRENEIFGPGEIDGEIELIEEQLNDPNLSAEQRDELNRLHSALLNELFLINSSQNAILEKTDFNGDGLPDLNIDADIIDGQEGKDTLKGSRFKDSLIGGAGSDTFLHSQGSDIIVGGTDDDGEDIDEYLIDATTNDDFVTITARQGQSSNLEFVVEINGKESVFDPEMDVEAIGVNGLGGNDTMNANFGRNALVDVKFDGGSGDDTIHVGLDEFLYDDDGALILDESGQPIQSKATLLGGEGNDSLTGGLSDDFLDGGPGNDTLIGGEGTDTMEGGVGDDILNGGIGQDTLRGGVGNDTLTGGEGDDMLEGGDGDDILEGGTGDDTLRAGNGNDYAYGNNGDDEIHGEEGHDQLWGEGVGGENGNDRIYGGDGNDIIWAGNGNDYAYGNNGDDEIHGEAGHDRLWGEGVGGENGNDRIYGGDGNEIIWAGNGNDIVQGDNGNDELYGEAGNDYLFGNSGNDFIHGGSGYDDTSFDAEDRITEIQVADGRKIEHADGRYFYLTGHGVYTSNSSYSWRLETGGVQTMVGAQGTVYILHDNRAVWEWRNGTFNVKVNGNEVSGWDINKLWVEGHRIRVLPDHGNINEFDRYTRVWSQIGPTSRQPLLTTSAGWFMLSHDDAVYSFQQNTNTWKKETGHDISHLVANHGTVYVLSRNNMRVWKFTNGTFNDNWISGANIVDMWIDGSLLWVLQTNGHANAYNGSGWLYS